MLKAALVRTCVVVQLISIAVPAFSFKPPLRQAIGTSIIKGARAAAGGPSAACMSSSNGQPVRVGVVGAGVAGCALAKKLKDAGANVTIFEMGRGAGGRMATRKTRDFPGLAINHGAPLFTASKEPFKELLTPLIAAGKVKKFEGRVVDIDASHFRAEDRILDGDTYTSSPDMNSMCEALVEGIDTRFGTQVTGIAKEGKEWVLSGKDQQELGRFEWCVVTSHTVGHKRWEQVFGYAPPLQTLAETQPALKTIVDPLQEVSSDPIMVAMMAFSRQDAAAILALEFDVAHLTNHPILSRIVRHESGSYVSLCFHSTPQFAQKYEHVYGSTSAAAKLAADKWASEDNKKKEEQVLAELLEAATAACTKLNCLLPPPVFGPILHRWGSAFTYSAEAATVDESLGFAVCGDFAGQTSVKIYSGVEAAAVSGLDLASKILSLSRARM